MKTFREIAGYVLGGLMFVVLLPTILSGLALSVWTIVYMKRRGIKDETLDTIRECGIDLNHWLEGFRDTETSVRKTVKTIQTHPLIPKDVTVRGFIIDSVTGELQEIK